MLLWAFEFPVRHETTIDTLVSLVGRWLSDSPHSLLRLKLQHVDPASAHWSITEKGERIDCRTTETGTSELVGVRYTKTENESLEWTTTVVGLKSPSAFWVSVRLSCDALLSSARIPEPNKPYLVKLILKEIGGGFDGTIPHIAAPHRLSEADIDFAASAMLGRAENRLPVVYLSATEQGKHLLDPKRLALAVSGMAHVLVEPSRRFSFRLMHEVNSINTYGGTVGLYFPEGGAHKPYYIGPWYSSPRDIEENLLGDLRESLTARRPTPTLTLAFIDGTIATARIAEIRKSGLQELDDFWAIYQQDVESKAQQLRDAEAEIMNLRNQLARAEARPRIAATGLLTSQQEQEFYKGEFVWHLIEALKAVAAGLPGQTRRKHILEDVIRSTQVVTDQDQIESSLRSVLDTLEKPEGTQRRALERLGFVFADEGKHLKISFFGDSRYTFVMSRTPSDHRGARNLSSEVRKQIFG